ncbi:unnamed protein product [Cuscuta campestris]|uniref:Uncharacterized protein n=1 Tax=Cuscuta campestris TaxID=132261 RepID=A0A484NE22_9ASTE|nr:unnamed protein product [Cuscuta campestris]
MLQGPQLGILCSFMSLTAWLIVISPIVVLIMWGSWLTVILGRDIIGLAVVMGGTAILLAFYSIMLWWRTQWQSSSISTCVDKNFDRNSLPVCSSSCIENQGCESSASAPINQQMLDLNLTLSFQEKLNDPRITSMLKRKARQGDLELSVHP